MNKLELQLMLLSLEIKLGLELEKAFAHKLAEEDAKIKEREELDRLNNVADVALYGDADLPADELKSKEAAAEEFKKAKEEFDKDIEAFGKMDQKLQQDMIKFQFLNILVDALPPGVNTDNFQVEFAPLGAGKDISDEAAMDLEAKNDSAVPMDVEKPDNDASFSQSPKFNKANSNANLINLLGLLGGFKGSASPATPRFDAGNDSDSDYSESSESTPVTPRVSSPGRR